MNINMNINVMLYNITIASLLSFLLHWYYNFLTLFVLFSHYFHNIFKQFLNQF